MAEQRVTYCSTEEGGREEAKLTPLVSTLAYNASVSLAMNFKMLAKLTLCSFLSSTPTPIVC